MVKSRKNSGAMFEVGKRMLGNIRNKRVMKALLLAGLIVSQARYPLDLVAEGAKNAGGVEQNFVADNGVGTNAKNIDMEIQINCAEGEENLAEFCRDVMLDVACENPVSANMFAKMADAGVKFFVTGESQINNGSYLVGRNEIDIPKNVIMQAMKNDKDLSVLKETLRHEGVHFLQDKCGIFDDCKKLSPRDACVVSTMTELDAMVKSYVMGNPKSLNVNNTFDCLVDLVPLLSGYTENALWRVKILGVVDEAERLKLCDVAQKFNMAEFGEYDDIMANCKKLEALFDEKIREKIEGVENVYNIKKVAKEENKDENVAMATMARGNVNGRE